METLLEFFKHASILSLFLKLFGIISTFLYFFFAWIVVTQVKSLKETISINDDGLILTLAYFQLVLAGILVVVALFIL